jgi:hypothetical protein
MKSIITEVLEISWKELIGNEQDRKRKQLQEAESKKELWMNAYRTKMMRVEVSRVVDMA